MKRLFLVGLLLSCARVSANVSDEWRVPDAHRPLTVMGRDFWPVLYKYGDWGQWYRSNRVRFDHPEILRIPAFAEAAPAYFSRASAPAAETGLAAWRTLADNFAADDPDREILAANPHPERPLFVTHVSKRGILSFGGRVDLDRDAYAAWRSAHPNLMHDGMLSEWDNDFMLAYSRVGKIADETRRREIRALLGEAPPKDRYARVAKMRQYYDWRRKISYGGTMCVGFSHILSGHLGADCGASLLSVEQTNTTRGDMEYRWNYAPMFARGAARQFGIPWLWYQADYMHGYTKDGRLIIDSDCVYPADAADRGGSHWGPAFGQSSSLVRRGLFYAYLNGANFTEVEQWSSQFLTWDAQTGRTELSPRAKDYISFHDFTRRHPARGTPWTPVAFCLPLAQGYNSFGGYPWETWDLAYGYTDGDYTVDSIFFSLVPGFARDAAMRKGVETNLHNTPHAMMYDVICPDAPSRTPEQLLATFRGYRALVVAGDYPDRSFERVLDEYARTGGQVLWLKELKRPADAHRAVADLRSGKTRFPETERLLEGLAARHFPFRVEGDCLYGANRTESGWWLWVFNNRGVTKFADAAEQVDPSAAARIRVTSAQLVGATVREIVSEREVCVSDDALSWTVGAGEVAVFEVTVPRGVQESPWKAD